jgi:hypothetical protein
VPAGVPAGGFADARTNEPRPHLAAGLLHPLHQEPRGRICRENYKRVELRRRVTRPPKKKGGGVCGRVGVAVRVVRRSRTFERRVDGGDADLPRHAARVARPEGGLGLHADVRRRAAALRRHPLRPRVWLGLVRLACLLGRGS